MRDCFPPVFLLMQERIICAICSAAGIADVVCSYWGFLQMQEHIAFANAFPTGTSIDCAEYSDARDIFAGAGVDLDVLSGRQIFRYLYNQSGAEGGRFGAGRGRGGLHAGCCVSDLEYHGCR